MRKQETLSIPRLSLIHELVEMWHGYDILYCHWKSNEHLAASMQGDTDLDILFDRSQQSLIERIFEALGFKLFEAIPEKQYKDIVDFIGLDEESGKLVHVHTHYRLTMGEQFLKGYQPNIETQILKNRRFDETFGIYVIEPAFELVLLFVRESLKLRTRDFIAGLVKKQQCNKNAIREFNWLRERTTDGQLYAAARHLFTNADEVYSLVSLNFEMATLRKLSRVVRREFRSARLQAPFLSALSRWYREIRVRGGRYLARLFNRPILSRRTNPRGGIAVAIIGADGSGKSTITENLRITFGTKLDVFKIYFGRGDGRASFARRVLSSLKRIFFKKRSASGAIEKSARIQSRNFLGRWLKAIEAIVVALEKRANLRLMLSARGKGALVICDRFPQNQVMGYNDGPLLHPFLQSRDLVLRAMARFESAVYTEAEELAPDLVIKLIADAEIVESRKPGETSIEKLRDKIQGIRDLRFKSCTVVTIDAGKPLTEVTLQTKACVWKEL